MAESPDDLPARLRTVMAQRGMSNRALAQSVGVDPATVSQWRSGAFPPSDENLVAAARALDVSPSWLRFGTDAPQGLPRISPITAAMLGGHTAMSDRQRRERAWIARFKAELLDMGALEEEIDAAETLVQVPEARALFRTEPSETVGLTAMRWLGDAIKTELQRRLAGNAPTIELPDPTKDRKLTDQEIARAVRQAEGEQTPEATPATPKRRGGRR